MEKRGEFGRLLYTNREGKTDYLGTHYLALLVAVVLVASFFLFPLNSPTGALVTGDNATYVYDGPEQITFTSQAVMDLDTYFSQEGLTYLATASEGATVSVSGSTLTVTAQSPDTTFDVTVVGSIGEEFLSVPLSFTENDAVTPTALVYPLGQATHVLQNGFGVNQDTPVVDSQNGVVTYSAQALDLPALSSATLFGTQVFSNVVKARLGKVTDEPLLQTQMFAIEDVTVSSAQLVLAKYANVEDIYKCQDFDTDLFTCDSGWVPTPISFNQNATHVWFSVSDFSGYAGGGQEGATNLYDCETLDTAGTTYLLMNDVSTNTACFTVEANDIILDCQNNEVNFAGVTSGAGVDVNGHTNVTIQNCELTRTGGAGSSPGVRFTDANSNTVKDSTLSGSSGAELTNSESNLFENVELVGSQTGVSLSSQSNLNQFTNSVLQGTNAIVLDSSSNNLFEDSNVWGNDNHIITNTDADGNLFRRQDFESSHAKVHLNGEFFFPDATTLDSMDVRLDHNYVYVNSDDHSYLNMPGQVTLYNVEHVNPVIGIDRDDDSTFADCESPECSIVSNDVINKKLVFDVEHFTAYTSAGSSGGFSASFVPTFQGFPGPFSNGQIFDFCSLYSGFSNIFFLGGIDQIDFCFGRLSCAAGGSATVQACDGSDCTGGETNTVEGCGSDSSSIYNGLPPGGGVTDKPEDSSITSNPGTDAPGQPGTSNEFVDPKPMGASTNCPEPYDTRHVGLSDLTPEDVMEDVFGMFPRGLLTQGGRDFKDDIESHGPAERDYRDQIRLDAQGGQDRLLGSPGEDIIRGADRDDILIGEGGRDTLRGDSGRDDILGSQGVSRDDFIISGRGGQDRISGAPGRDTTNPNNADRAGGGIETIRGSDFDDTLRGEPGRDTIFNEGYESGDTSNWAGIADVTGTMNRITGAQVYDPNTVDAPAKNPDGSPKTWDKNTVDAPKKDGAPQTWDKDPEPTDGIIANEDEFDNPIPDYQQRNLDQFGSNVIASTADFGKIDWAKLASASAANDQINLKLLDSGGKVLQDECSCTIYSAKNSGIYYYFGPFKIWVPTTMSGVVQYGLTTVHTPRGTFSPGDKNYPREFFRMFPRLLINELKVPIFDENGNPTGKTTIIKRGDPGFEEMLTKRYPKPGKQITITNYPEYPGQPGGSGITDLGGPKVVKQPGPAGQPQKVRKKPVCGNFVPEAGEQCDNGPPGAGLLGLAQAILGRNQCSAANPAGGPGQLCIGCQCKPAPSICGDGVVSGAEQCEKLGDCPQLFVRGKPGAMITADSCTACKCVYPKLDCDYYADGPVECGTDSDCEKNPKYGPGATCSNGATTRPGAAVRDACKCYPAGAGAADGDPGRPDPDVTPFDPANPQPSPDAEGDSIFVITSYVPQSMDGPGIPPNPQNSIAYGPGDRLPAQVPIPTPPPGMTPESVGLTPQPISIQLLPPGTPPSTPSSPGTGTPGTPGTPSTPPGTPTTPVIFKDPATGLPLSMEPIMISSVPPPMPPVLTPPKADPSDTPVMVPPPMPKVFAPPQVAMPTQVSLSPETGASCAYFVEDASTKDFKVTSVQPGELQGLPEGYEFVNTPFSINCAGDKLALSVGATDDYTDLQSYRCTNGLCTPLRDKPTGSDLFCGDKIMDQVVLDNLNPPGTQLSFDPNQIRGAPISIDKEHARIDIAGYALTFSPDYIIGSFQVQAWNPTQLPAPTNVHQLLVNTPITLEFKNLPAGPLPLLLNALYSQHKQLEDGAYNVYAIVDGVYIPLDTYGSVEDGNLRVPINDLKPLLNADQQVTFVVLGTACDACQEAIFEKVYDGGGNKAVVLVHGFASSSLTWNMLIEDFRTNNRPEQLWVYSYPSTSGIDDIASKLEEFAEGNSLSWNSVDFIGHSLGGMVTQKALYDGSRNNRRFIGQTGKAIIVGSPNDGTPVAEVYSSVLGYLTNLESFTRPLPGTPELLGSLIFGEDIPQVDSVTYEVLAGTKTLPFTNRYFPGNNDGIAAESSAQHIGNEFINDKCSNYFETDLTHTQLIDYPLGRRVLNDRLSTSETGLSNNKATKEQFLQLLIDQCSANDIYVVVGKPVPQEAQLDILNCNCGNGVCGVGENPGNCPSDCALLETPESPGMPGWLKVALMSLLFIILIALVVFMLTRGHHGKGGSSSSRNIPPPSRPSGPKPVPKLKTKANMPTIEPLSAVAVMSKPKKKKQELEVYHDEPSSVPAADKLMIKNLFSKKQSTPRELNRNVRTVESRMRKDSAAALSGKMKDLDDIDATLARIRQTTKELESRIAKRGTTRKSTARKAPTRRKTAGKRKTASSTRRKRR